MARRRSRSKSGRGKTQAQLADVHRLYEEAVQDPEGDVAIVQRIFRKRYDRDPRSLREDFCGTAVMACAFVKDHADNRAWGVDLDPEPLEWGRAHHVSKLEEPEQQRVHLMLGDVRDVVHEPVDVTVGFNFSYFVFKQREKLVAYFRKALSTLREDGLFIVDLYGGAEAQRTLTETREHDEFDYVWDQDEFDPIHHHAMNYIHFEFPDGSRIDRAFTYDWRLWTIPEMRDAMREAGFSETEAYWERTDHKTNEGTGVYYKTERAADDPAWVAYVVGVR